MAWRAGAWSGCAWSILCATALAAQHPHGPTGDRPAGDSGSVPSAPAVSFALGGQATPAVSRVAPAMAGKTLTEGFVSSPVLTAHANAWGRRLSAMMELNLEGLTLSRGELTPGIYGEGYVDRRHPHTYLHEAVVTAAGTVAGVRASLSAGKGFAPFGTDDPMSRPLLKFPVNHHLAQVLERGLVVVAGARGPVALEAALFNGDEPTRPQDMPNWSRLGDSWAARATVTPLDGVAGYLELQASHARVRSPEFRDGGGLDQRKWSMSARYADTGHPARPYALVEWARTGEYARDRRVFAVSTVLAEASALWRGFGLAARAERTNRPESERLLDPFRTPRPPHDQSVLGITRWDIVTGRVSRASRAGPLGAEPFVEIASAAARATIRPSFFEPAAFYGAGRIWSMSAGVRLTVGAPHGRMGRYGAASAQHAAEHAVEHAPMDPTAPHSGH